MCGQVGDQIAPAVHASAREVQHDATEDGAIPEMHVIAHGMKVTREATAVDAMNTRSQRQCRRAPCRGRAHPLTGLSATTSSAGFKATRDGVGPARLSCGRRARTAGTCSAPAYASRLATMKHKRRATMTHTQGCVRCGAISRSASGTARRESEVCLTRPRGPGPYMYHGPSACAC